VLHRSSQSTGAMSVDVALAAELLWQACCKSMIRLNNINLACWSVSSASANVNARCERCLHTAINNEAAVEALKVCEQRNLVVLATISALLAFCQRHVSYAWSAC
jgi:hypothetical protein